MELALAYVRHWQIKMAHVHKLATMDTASIDTWRKVNRNHQMNISRIVNQCKFHRRQYYPKLTYFQMQNVIAIIRRNRIPQILFPVAQMEYLYHPVAALMIRAVLVRIMLMMQFAGISSPICASAIIQVCT